MLNQNKILDSRILRVLSGLTLFFVLTIPTTPNPAVAQTQQQNVTDSVSLEETPVSRQFKQFKKLEQPLGLKLAVAISGLGLIGAELWWFVFSKPKS